MMITGEWGASEASTSVAWMPSISGMLTSMRMTSGPSLSASATASLPLVAVATTSMSSSKERSFRRLSRVLEMSSTIKTLIVLTGFRRERSGRSRELRCGYGTPYLALKLGCVTPAVLAESFLSMSFCDLRISLYCPVANRKVTSSA